MATLAVNKKTKFDYDLIDEYEGGLVLSGAEVKSAKKGNVNMKGSFITVQKNELWVKNMHIGKYAPAGKQEDYEPTQDRRIIVHRNELKQLIGKHKAEGLTIVPIRVYTKGALVKIAFALARGKKKHEKRDAIKKRDTDREIREEMKKRRYAD